MHSEGIKPIFLGINIDHVATLRQARQGREPDPVLAAQLAELAGADGIVCHLREDRRHIQERDLYRLRESIKTRLNLEMSLNPDVFRIALQVKPDQVTFVPEQRQELTTESGFLAFHHPMVLRKRVDAFHRAGIEVSFFINPDQKAVQKAQEAGSTRVEFHTGFYAHAQTLPARQVLLRRLLEAVAYAKSLHLAVAAGHGLDYTNVLPIASLIDIEELNIGFSVMSRAFFVGLSQAVCEMKHLLEQARYLSTKTISP